MPTPEIRALARARMRRLGLSQARLAARSGVPASRISRWLSGKTPLTLPQWWRVMAALRVRTRLERALRAVFEEDGVDSTNGP